MLGIWGSLAAHRFEGPVLSWREPWAGSQETGAVPGVVFDLVHVLKQFSLPAGPVSFRCKIRVWIRIYSFKKHHVIQFFNSMIVLSRGIAH